MEQLESGVYRIINIVNKKCYIGSSKYIVRRFKEHRSMLKQKQHNKHLQRAWDKYGEDFFIFEVVEYCFIDMLLQKEQYWIDFYESYKRENGYNLNSNATGGGFNDETKKQISKSLLGSKHSKETIEKRKNSIKRAFLFNPEFKEHLQKSSKIHWESLEYRKKVSEGLKKNWMLNPRGHTEETKAKISTSLKGRTLTQEQYEKLKIVCSSESHKEKCKKNWEKFKNSTDYELFRERQSLRNKGKIFSMEQRAKLSKASKGRVYSEETKNKQSLAHLGKEHSEETKEKLRLLNMDFKYTEERNLKISKKLKGVKKSPRTLEHTKNFKMSVAWGNRNKKQIILYKNLFPNNYGQLLNIVNY